MNKKLKKVGEWLMTAGAVVVWMFAVVGVCLLWLISVPVGMLKKRKGRRVKG